MYSFLQTLSIVMLFSVATQPCQPSIRFYWILKTDPNIFKQVLTLKICIESSATHSTIWSHLNSPQHQFSIAQETGTHLKINFNTHYLKKQRWLHWISSSLQWWAVSLFIQVLHLSAIFRYFWFYFLFYATPLFQRKIMYVLLYCIYFTLSYFAV